MSTQIIWMIFIKILKNAIQILIAFDNMIAAMLSNKILNPIVIELFVKARKLSISVVFVTQSCTAVSKTLT